MPAKLGLRALSIACALAVAAAAPVMADTGATVTSPPADTSTVTTPPSNTIDPDTVSPDTTSPSTTSQPAQPLTVGGVVGPATVSGQTPTRGTQLQISPPPPPPPSPFDPPFDGGNGRRVVYSKTQQTVWAYDENNVIIKMHRVSGRLDAGDPPPGVYRVWSRSIRTFAINNPSITWNYMVRFAKGDRDGNIGFHDIPYQYGRPVQTIDQLGQALSGGCVRQAPDDAIWMWNWAQLGTVVIVTA